MLHDERSNGNRKIVVKKPRSERSRRKRREKSGSSQCWGGGTNRYGTKKAEGCRKWEAIGCCFSKALQRALSHVQIGAFVCLAASMERHTHAEHSAAYTLGPLTGIRRALWITRHVSSLGDFPLLFFLSFLLFLFLILVISCNMRSFIFFFLTGWHLGYMCLLFCSGYRRGRNTNGRESIPSFSCTLPHVGRSVWFCPSFPSMN